jgi:hypothetical protein
MAETATETPDVKNQRFTIEGKTYPLADPNDLTFGEIEQIEDAFGVPIEDIDWRMQKFARWLVYISIHRHDAESTIKFDDLGEMRFQALDWSEEKPKPKTPAKRRPTKARKGA